MTKAVDLPNLSQRWHITMKSLTDLSEQTRALRDSTTFGLQVCDREPRILEPPPIAPILCPTQRPKPGSRHTMSVPAQPLICEGWELSPRIYFVELLRREVKVLAVWIIMSNLGDTNNTKTRHAYGCRVITLNVMVICPRDRSKERSWNLRRVLRNFCRFTRNCRGAVARLAFRIREVVCIPLAL